MAGDTVITVVGNLTADPELRYTQGGAPVANFTIASTPRELDKQSNAWKDGEPLFLRASVWRDHAENVAASLTKGMRVIVQGKLKQRSYQTKEGEKRTSFELDVEEIGPALKYATAQVARSASGKSQAAPSGSNGWAASPSQGQGNWGAPAGSQASGGFDDEPPF